MTNHTPKEAVLFGAAIGLEYAGIPKDVFDPAAPIAGCRLCGAVFQTKHHRELHNKRLDGMTDPPALLQKVLDMNNDWREKHTTRNHTEEEIEVLVKLGWAFMPAAAHKLAPYGIVPLGNAYDVDIVDAMYEAPRAPDLTMLEGGG